MDSPQESSCRKRVASGCGNPSVVLCRSVFKSHSALQFGVSCDYADRKLELLVLQLLVSPLLRFLRLRCNIFFLFSLQSFVLRQEVVQISHCRNWVQVPPGLPLGFLRRLSQIQQYPASACVSVSCSQYDAHVRTEYNFASLHRAVLPLCGFVLAWRSVAMATSYTVKRKTTSRKVLHAKVK